MAASLAAYAAKSGVKSVILVTSNISAEKLSQISIYNPLLFEFDLPYQELYKISYEMARNLGVVLIHSDSPLRIEGQKTIAYEIVEQLNWRSPDFVIVPTSSGGNLSAIWKGFKEFYDLGFIDSLPKIIAVQSEGCAPIVKAFKEKKGYIEPWDKPNTIAHSISNPNPALASGNRVLRILRKSESYAETVSDNEMINYVEIIAKKEGLFVEPASAASVAIVNKLLNDGIVDKSDLIVSILTGSGLKELHAVRDKVGKTIKVNTYADLKEILRTVRIGENMSL